MNTFRAAIVVVAILPATAFGQPVVAKPGPEITKLASQVVGTWSYEGAARANPYGPAGKTKGTDVWELGPGGFSVLHRWNEQNPIAPTTGLEVITWDASKKSLVGSYYSSLGETGGGALTLAGDTYTYPTTGITWEGKPAWSKCTWTFAGAKTLKVKCDASPDGKAWMPAVFEGTWTKK